jgi:DNA (cytosine-5)-methyltransferase 1
MDSRGWPGVRAWRTSAGGIAPTIVAGSKKHAGPDLGPTRARQAWRKLRIGGMGIADDPPGPGFPAAHLPRLTLRMVARIRGFPDTRTICGRKTAAYRQVGRAFPPPVAAALGKSIRAALSGATAADSRPVYGGGATAARHVARLPTRKKAPERPGGGTCQYRDRGVVFAHPAWGALS